MSERTATPTQPRPTAAHRLEYWALRAAIGALRTSDWRRAGAIGARLATLGYEPFGVRRRVVERQIAAALPHLSEAQVKDVARDAYAHLGRVTAESALLPSLGSEGVLAMFDRIDGWQHVERAMAVGRGLIFVTGHVGNWELAGTYVAARGVPVDVIVRRMSNPLFDSYLNALRLRLGMTIVYDHEAVRRVPRALAAGRGVGMLADQAGKGIAAIYVPFFGRPARTPHGPAVFALRADIPMVFAAAVRGPAGLYRMGFEPIEIRKTGERDRDIEALVRQYTGKIEELIRAHPAQYFWHHHRWKRQPPGTPPELRDPVSA